MGLLVPAPPTFTDQRNYSGRPTTTWGTTLTGGAANTLSASFTELVASTTYESRLLAIQLYGTQASATNTDLLVNLYTGANGSEQPFIMGLLGGWAHANVTIPGLRYIFPVLVPRGTRITAKCQGVIASDTVGVMLELYQGDANAWAGGGVESLGVVTASSRGTLVTPGTTSEGTFTSIGTSGRRYRYLLVMKNSNNDGTATDGMHTVDVGTGSALIAGLENFLFFTSGSEYSSTFQHEGRYCDIASGTALQARLQSHTTDAENKAVVFYGVY